MTQAGRVGRRHVENCIVMSPMGETLHLSPDNDYVTVTPILPLAGREFNLGCDV